MLKRMMLVVTLALMMVGGAIAQSTTGTITGTVSDVTGAVLPGVGGYGNKRRNEPDSKLNHERVGKLHCSAATDR